MKVKLNEWTLSKDTLLEVPTEPKYAKANKPRRNVEITLLSVEEAEVLKMSLRAFPTQWWLRTPGDAASGSSAIVGPSGMIYQNGADVTDYNVGVRPALKLTGFNMSKKPEIGTPVHYFNTSWIYCGVDSQNRDILLASHLNLNILRDI